MPSTRHHSVDGSNMDLRAVSVQQLMMSLLSVMVELVFNILFTSSPTLTETRRGLRAHQYDIQRLFVNRLTLFPSLKSCILYVFLVFWSSRRFSADLSRHQIILFILRRSVCS